MYAHPTSSLESVGERTPFLEDVDKEFDEALPENGFKNDRSVSLFPRATGVVESREQSFAAVELDKPRFSQISPHVSSFALLSLRDGCCFQQLIDQHADDVIPVLRDLAVRKLGSFNAKDTDVAKAFGSDTMLTNSLDVCDDPFWEANWREIVQLKSRACRKTCSFGWETTLTLSAYAVQIGDIADPKKGDLIALLFKKTASAAAPAEVWKFPAVRAVINYHWQHWARRLLLSTFAVFALWAICFAIYVCIYIESDPFGKVDSAQESPVDTLTNKASGTRTGSPSRTTPRSLGTEDTLSGVAALVKDPHDRHYGSFSDDLSVALTTYVLVALSFVFMLFFAVEEYWTIFVQGRDWISWHNFLDLLMNGIQTVICFCHLFDAGLDSDPFGWLLATQTVLLSIRVLRFVSLLGEGSTFLNTALAVIYSVRYWIAYIIFTGLVAALCLGALYKQDQAFQDQHKEFGTVHASLVTSFKIIFSSYDLKYIFDADNPWVKFLFFFVFELFMAVTVLNLLIAAMSESYLSVTQHREIQRYRGRAMVIDELNDLIWPMWVIPKTKKYIHFLVIEEGITDLIPRLSLESNQKSEEQDDDDLKSEVRHLRSQLDDMSKLMRRLVHPVENGNGNI